MSQPTGTVPAAAVPFQTRAGAYALIVQDRSVLLSAWRSPSDDVYWTLPGGGIELGESPEQACVREVWEETGYDCRLVGLLGVTTGHIPAAKRLRGEPVDLLTVQVLYRGEITGGTLRPEVGGSSYDARWFGLDELDSVLTSSWLTSALRLGGHLPTEEVA
ncbi:NUDIX hydrolase [Micrococcus lylae]|uniref:NUDIX domain-containing protein n=1 Tax=Micrococcus lylae TaxID=1273 RepID=A0ABY2K1D4_9MICC|nr:NUDIX domain-containing protein [Micrococcus lylae]TFI00455.1 NUDIX domain-containing protein [Micrococcus lylae]WIK83306.1 NUDIX domain-containing protein [Micrococcus lylae]